MKQLKNTWNKLSAKLDAMTLRERALVFVAATGLILFLLYTLAVEPLLARQAALLAQIQQQQNQVSGIDTEIAARAQGFVLDPDAEARAQLQQARAEIDSIGARLVAVQKGLVAPEKIAPLLEHLLQGGKLKLLALRTLPVTGMNEAAGSAAPAAPAEFQAPDPAAALEPALQQSALQKTPPPATPAGALTAAPTTAPTSAPAAAPPPVAQPGHGSVAGAEVKAPELLYRHGVEIVVQGSYLEMINYMQALEALPVQLFWGGARLDAQQYPEARLTLTLYTLSLDEKWMKL
ncbi:UNVERIFIED_ORG: MSHA biogenesis protein MshJ [Zoogloea ramigera]|uniref:Type II secretion system protein M n=1 Tax=Duganella zoogloeoides TaxID=75659 RepID=A0ABZ0Y5N4_9BURK|nr:type II secretion system protein M [Duganella zoogloeoides]WQH06716.1 type II secretion system protein M [Duganella zoogloeoides]